MAPNAHRISVSLNEEQYRFIRTYAEQKRVSLAWAVREALQALMHHEAPLFMNLSKPDRSDAKQ